VPVDPGYLSHKLTTQESDRATLPPPLYVLLRGLTRAVATFVLLICMSAVALAQTATDYVFHVYVDPLYGDDVLASATLAAPASTTSPATTNRGNPTVGTVLRQHPFGANWISLRNAGPIQHAPFSFRTVNGTQGALSYIQQFLPLPRTIVEGDATRRMTHIVIHCLPGTYSTGTGVDPSTGLPRNDERFPIVLSEDLERVSIQGTSALNTVSDAQGQAVNIFEITRATASTQQNPTVTHTECFLDSLTIRGARADGDEAYQGAGILIRGVDSIDVTVANCFIVDNQVGVGIVYEPGSTTSSSPRTSASLASTPPASRACIATTSRSTRRRVRASAPAAST
jgi:hypothetical protein